MEAQFYWQVGDSRGSQFAFCVPHPQKSNSVALILLFAKISHKDLLNLLLVVFPLWFFDLISLFPPLINFIFYYYTYVYYISCYVAQGGSLTLASQI